MPDRDSTRANTLLLAVLLFALLLLMAGSLRQQVDARAIENAVAEGTSPLVGAARTVGGSISGAVRFVRDARTFRLESDRLRSEIAGLRGEIQGLDEAAQENRRLRCLLGMRDALAPRSVGATVTTTQLSGQSRMLVIDRGTSSGVGPDMPVVTWGGLVGRVIAADTDAAKVRLLSDPNSGVAGIVQRSRTEGMVLGRGDGPLELAYVPKYADVEVGDRVVTSGLDGIFPKGFGIGTVTAVSDPAGASKAIELEPEVDFGSLEDVLVLHGTLAGGTRLPEPQGSPTR